MDDPKDILAKMRADADQAIEGTREFARMTAAYYRELIEEGINDELAAALALNYTTSFLRAAASAYGEEDDDA